MPGTTSSWFCRFPDAFVNNDNNFFLIFVVPMSLGIDISKNQLVPPQKKILMDKEILFREQIEGPVTLTDIEDKRKYTKPRNHRI